MSGFFARRKDAVRRLFMREPGTAGRVVAVSQVLITLAGVAPVVLSPDPTFGLLLFAFIGAIIGLFLTGSAELVSSPAAVYRASLRVLGLILMIPMMLALLVVAVGRLSD